MIDERIYWRVVTILNRCLRHYYDYLCRVYRHCHCEMMAGVFYVTNDIRCCHDVLVETVVVHVVVVVVALKVASHLDRDLLYHGLALFLVLARVRVLFRDLDLCLDPCLVNYKNEKMTRFNYNESKIF